MRMNWIALALFFLAPFVFVGMTQTPGAENVTISEKQKIEALIKVVADGHDVKFVRNDKAYDSATAASFLKRKWEANESKVKTARDFVDNVGSFSGTSGEPYRLRYKDGREVRSRDFLLAELARIEKSSIYKGNHSSSMNPPTP